MSESTEIQQTEAKAIDIQTECALAFVENLTIEDDEGFNEAMALQKDLRALEKKIKEYWEPSVKAAHLVHKGLKAKENEQIKPITAGIKSIQLACGSYTRECQIRDEAERRMVEAQAREAQAAANEETAQAFDEQGNSDLAKTVRGSLETQQQMAVESIKFESSAPQVSGQKSRTTWHFEIEDASKIPAMFMMPDEKAIGAFVRSKKGDAIVPGVRIYSETKVLA
jgi:hypothetical protein